MLFRSKLGKPKNYIQRDFLGYKWKYDTWNDVEIVYNLDIFEV